jgi:glycosyltransferase involved in cell wall biosynthesis
MKIICISASQVPATTANSIQVMKTCQALAQTGHEVRLLVPRSGQPDATNEAWPRLAQLYGLQTPFEIEWLPASPRWRRWDFCWTAVRRVKRLGGQMVYAWPLQAAVFANLFGFPVILELHGPPEGRIGRRLFGYYLRRGGKKRYLPITQALVDLLESVYHRKFKPGEVVIAPNGVDLERYHNLPSPSEARAALGLEENFSVGYTGHLYPGRGMVLLVELARRFPAIHFVWVGGRPQDVDGWKKQLSDEKIGNITLTGFVENSRLPLYQAAMDVLLMPYERQISGSGGGDSADYCSPMKMFEYMGCGRAIISSDLPVIREVLNNSNSVLCPPEDYQAWAQTLERLSIDRAKRDELGRSALHDVHEFTWLRRAQKALANWELP